MQINDIQIFDNETGIEDLTDDFADGLVHTTVQRVEGSCSPLNSQTAAAGNVIDAYAAMLTEMHKTDMMRNSSAVSRAKYLNVHMKAAQGCRYALFPIYNANHWTVMAHDSESENWRHYNEALKVATQTAPYYFPCMDGTQQSMYVPAHFSQMQMVDNIGGTSHTQLGIVNNISSQSSTIASNFVHFNVDADPNVPFFFLVSHCTLMENELLSLLHDEQDAEDKMIHTDVSDEDLERILDCSDLIVGPLAEDGKPDFAVSLLSLKRPGCEDAKYSWDFFWSGVIGLKDAQC
ncbi:ATP-dependent DNA helicase DDM1 [Camellia lanceoleosa]|uniref:ATP-dependent DNA helicase DDM1 n=1 Tax=Camellia lanceoleosa TaxID=1840588 RepID=A0ACC0FM49_9ERIC|nr:ATP-dependent DNA helicase DDM1 [Camellia lanceoleosa]